MEEMWWLHRDVPVSVVTDEAECLLSGRNQAEHSTYLTWFPKQSCKVLTVASPFYGCEDRAQGYLPASESVSKPHFL